ncbi:uncharacterized protein LOC126828877 [Patella vulgata]|uniref:uncharacterized protein LOC126828877 n=1 Tax=Patella vulgata TaxID=6465 RepID=UPI00217FBF1F|nr:uncharacterized protein LOC126828877 [Patella vulgata]XP_050414913.1 uncharacterized protein LOC126828877 [Patella vulgata]
MLLLILLGCLSVRGMDVPITKHYKGGFKAEFCEPITKDLKTWRGHLIFDRHIDSLDVYKAEVAQTLGGGTEFILTPTKGHFEVHTGEKVCLHFIAHVQGDVLARVQFYIEGMDGNNIHTIVTSKPDPSGILWHKNDFSTNDPTDGFSKLSKGHFDEDSLSVVNDPAGGSGKVMKVFIQKGHYVKIRGKRGAQFYTQSVYPHESMTLSYDVYFNKGMDFVLGGKLPGLYGGATNCTGGRHSDACLTSRFMWRFNGEGEIYTYMPAPTQQKAHFCDQPYIICDPTYGISLGNGTWSFKTGRWENIAQHVHLNTPGKLDGYAKIWYNGKKVYEIHNVNFRNHDNIQLKGLFFSVFFGGSKEIWAPTGDSSIYFKNFIVSTKETNPPHLIG